jgi:carboxypeptidase D
MFAFLKHHTDTYSQALTFVREFILGSNTNGTVVNNSTVGVSHPLADDILPGQTNPIFTGSGTTLGSTIWPSATVAAWNSFMATATATAVSAVGAKSNDGAASHAAMAGVAVVVAGIVATTLA